MQFKIPSNAEFLEVYYQKFTSCGLLEMLNAEKWVRKREEKGLRSKHGKISHLLSIFPQ